MYDAAWINDQQKTLYVMFEGNWQPDEFVDVQHDIDHMLDQIGHLASIIIHITEPRPIPMEMITQIQSLLRVQHPNCAKFFIVAPEGYLDGLTDVIRRSFGGAYPEYISFSVTLEHVENLLTT